MVKWWYDVIIQKLVYIFKLIIKNTICYLNIPYFLHKWIKVRYNKMLLNNFRLLLHVSPAWTQMQQQLQLNASQTGLEFLVCLAEDHCLLQGLQSLKCLELQADNWSIWLHTCQCKLHNYSSKSWVCFHLHPSQRSLKCFCQRSVFDFDGTLVWLTETSCLICQSIKRPVSPLLKLSLAFIFLVTSLQIFRTGSVYRRLHDCLYVIFFYGKFYFRQNESTMHL